MTLTQENLKILIDQLMLSHYGEVGGSPVDPIAQPIPDPAAEAAIDEAYMAVELNLIAQALSQHDEGRTHRDFLRGAYDVQSLLKGVHGEYARNVMQGILHTLDQGENYISTPADAKTFVETEVQRIANVLGDRRLSPQEMHDPEGNARAIEADRELLRDESDFDSAQKAEAAAETYRSTIALASGKSVLQAQEDELNDWAHNGTVMVGGEEVGGSIFDEEPDASSAWTTDETCDAVAATYAEALDAFTAEEEARARNQGEYVDALAAPTRSSSMDRAAEMDRAAAGVSEYGPDGFAQSKAEEQARWAKLMQGDTD